MNKTTMKKAAEIERKWYLVDATGKTLGRLSSKIASILRGKNKPFYAPHMDTGDFVVVINADRIHVTGNKRADKEYWRHSGYMGGLTKTNLEDMIKKDPTFPVKNAVKGMLPKNKLGKRLFRKLKVYAGSEHPHKAQAPQVLDI